jgi:uncharacterized protein YtpQ (UPF0354 family)
MAAVIWVMLAIPVFADTPVPKNIAETLDLMRDALQADTRVSNVIINYDENYLSFQIEGSEPQISFPDNLYLLLTQAESNAERTEILNLRTQAPIQSGVASIADAPIDIANIIPVIRHKNYGTEVLYSDVHPNLEGEDDQAYSTLISYPFVGEMRIFLVEDAPKFVRFIAKTELETFDLSANELLLEAVKNARSGLSGVRIDSQGGLNFLVFDGDYETSFLTMPQLWKQLDIQMGTIVAVVAARDLVLFVDGDDATAVADLREVIKPEISQFSYPISTTLITWKDGRWSLYD